MIPLIWQIEQPLKGLTIWYEVLFVVNSASKILQSKGMHIDVAINQLKTLINFFKNYRKIGFATDMSSAIEIAKELEIELVFQERHVICRKRHFDELLWKVQKLKIKLISIINLIKI